MDIRTATRSDGTAVRLLMDALVHEDAGRYDPAANLEWVRDHGQVEVSDRLGGDGRIDLIAENAEGPVGLLMGGYQQEGVFSSAAMARIGSLFVVPPHRGRGVGAALVERFVEEARALGAAYAEVTAYADNAAAIRFYTRHGLAPQALTLRRALPTYDTT